MKTIDYLLTIKPTDVAAVYVNSYNHFCNKNLPVTTATKKQFNGRFSVTRSRYAGQLTTEDFCACIVWLYMTNPDDYLSLASYANVQSIGKNIVPFIKWKKAHADDMMRSGKKIYEYVVSGEWRNDEMGSGGLNVEEYEKLYRRSRKVQKVGA